VSATLQKGKYSNCASAAGLREKLEAEGFDVFSWSDSPGAVYSDHSHPHDEYIVVASGRIVFVVDNQRFPLEAGDALDLPANTVHAAKNEDSRPVSYFICTR
jgi:quercetin dioxygenase-like cupin family protein